MRRRGLGTSLHSPFLLFKHGSAPVALPTVAMFTLTSGEECASGAVKCLKPFFPSSAGGHKSQDTPHATLYLPFLLLLLPRYLTTMVHSMIVIPPKWQCLIFAGKQLEDGWD